MAGLRYVAEQVLGSDFRNAGERIKPYALVDCGVRYEPSFLDGLRVTFGVDNLFGKNYCDYAGWTGTSSYWYPARDRFWKVGASYTF
jgi:outer membrane receptor protein involved in Fe transport